MLSVRLSSLGPATSAATSNGCFGVVDDKVGRFDCEATFTSVVVRGSFGAGARGRLMVSFPELFELAFVLDLT